MKLFLPVDGEEQGLELEQLYDQGEDVAELTVLAGGINLSLADVRVVHAALGRIIYGQERFDDEDEVDWVGEDDGE